MNSIRKAFRERSDDKQFTVLVIDVKDTIICWHTRHQIEEYIRWKLHVECLRTVKNKHPQRRTICVMM